MQTEIEAKFLNIDHDAMRQKLNALGAQRVHPDRLTRRRNYDVPSLERAWVRVRDEGDKITLTFKQMNNRTLHGTKEINLTIDSFDQAEAFLQTIGLPPSAYQETRRESWVLGDVQIELDEWPWIKPFLEIEAPNEELVRETAAQLGLDWEDALHGSVEVAYQAEFDLTEEQINRLPNISFNDQPPSDWQRKGPSK
jgi:adenylate cyclase, class 2